MKKALILLFLLYPVYVSATPVLGAGAQNTERFDVIQLTDDRLIQSEEPTTGAYADMIFVSSVDNNDSMFQFTGAAGNNAYLKISPNSTQTDVGITINAKGGEAVTTDSAFFINSGVFSLTKTSDDDVGGFLNFMKDTSSPSPGDVISSLSFHSRDDLNNDREYAVIESDIEDATNSSECGSLGIYVKDQGSLTKYISVDGKISAVTINPLLTLSSGVRVNMVDVNVSAYNVTLDDYLVGVSYTATGTATVTLTSAAVVAGQMFVISDTGGNAGVNNITVATEGTETINGAATYVINSNYEGKTFYSDGINWFVY